MPLHAGRLTDTAASFLAPFPEPVRRAVEAFVEGGAEVVGPDPDLRAFRRDPRAALARTTSVLDALWREAPPPGRVVWCVEGDPHAGLDAVEAGAVLGRFMHLEHVAQATANGQRRVVALGTLREEYVGVAVVAPPLSADALARWLAGLAAAPLPAAAFLAAGDADALAAREAGREATAALLDCGGTIGWLVRAQETDEVLTNPRGAAERFERLLGQRPRLVRFADENIDPAALEAFMEATGAVADTTLAAQGDPAPGLTAREGPYSDGAPYRPLPFDLRVPAFRANGAAWFELPRVPISPPLVPRWWTGRRGPSDEELALLLDVARMEAFFRLSRVDRTAERLYPEVRIYNWPAPAPARRVTLLDGGACAGGEATGLLEAVVRLAREAGPRLRAAAPLELLQVAAGEVTARYGLPPDHGLSLQGRAHEYLAALPHEAPLREDYAEFVRFVPPDLGDALELGSGYGVLAWALALRARRYVCLDLDPRMFARLRRDLRQAGVAADMHRLPFRRAAFDAVVANNVLEHLHDPLAGLREIRRVLRPGGRLLALVPFDALSSRHDLPAHYWKVDERGLRAALAAAGLRVDRLEVVDLYDLGVGGAFPSCRGLAAMVDAARPAEAGVHPAFSPVAPPDRLVAGQAGPGIRTGPAAATRSRRLAGRRLPIVRELTTFERWAGRRVVAVASEPSDVDEFARYGAEVVCAERPDAPWPVPDGAADLVYAFLSAPGRALDALAAEARRVLVPGGLIVAGFRHRESLRYLARIQSYYGNACDLRRLADPDALVRTADDDGAVSDDEYVTRAAVDAAFAAFHSRDVFVRGFTPEDLPGTDLVREARFWEWVSRACGRYVLLRAVR